MDHLYLIDLDLNLENFILNLNYLEAKKEVFSFEKLESFSSTRRFDGALVVIASRWKKSIRLEVLKEKFPDRKIVLIMDHIDESQITNLQTQGVIDLFFKAPCSLSEINEKVESIVSVQTETIGIALPEASDEYELEINSDDGDDLLENSSFEKEEFNDDLDLDQDLEAFEDQVEDFQENEAELSLGEDDDGLIPDLASELEGIDGDILGVNHTQTNLGELAKDLLDDVPNETKVDEHDISRILNSEVLLEKVQEQEVEDKPPLVTAIQEKTPEIKKAVENINTNLEEDLTVKKEVLETTKTVPRTVLKSNSSLDNDNIVLISRNELLEQENRALREKSIYLGETLESIKVELKHKELELGELRIKLDISKKRSLEENEDLKNDLLLSKQKVQFLEEYKKTLEDSNRKISKEKLIDVKTIRSREEELESKIELMREDLSAQVRNRENKIINLKRNLDIIKFDMQESSSREEDYKKRVILLEKKIYELKKSLGKSLSDIDNLDDYEHLKRKA